MAGIRSDTKAQGPEAPGEGAAPAGKPSALARMRQAVRGGTQAVRGAAEAKLAEQMIGKLDAFLDELAVGHRKAMEETVRWLTGHGDLDGEIQKSVDALNPLLQKWSIEICFLLRMKDTLRFNELKDGLPGIGSRTLSQRLKELEAQGIVQRTVFPEVPVRVEYKLTPKGVRMGDLFLPVIAHLRITGWREGKAKAAPT